METSQYTNYAFISYKREDEKWAKWLQKKLESYKLPSIVREQHPGMPKHLRPIFRDGTDLTGGILADQLRKELLQSRFLIVICSPNATKSEWVDKEAQTFIEEGRLEQIIPFIVGGIPHANNPAHECFPQSLRIIPAEKELLGINVLEVGKEMAFIRLVATMLGVRFDTLWQRHRRDLIRRRIAYGCVATLLCILGLFVWDYNRPTYKYFADWVDCYGMPEGIIPLTDKQVAHRHRTYQFEYRRIPFGEPNAYSWRITKVSYVNSAKRAQNIDDTELKDRYPIQEMEYNKQTGVVSRINFYDTKGNVLLRHVLSERDGVTAAVADFVDSQEQRGTGFIGANLSSMRLGQMDARQQKSNIVRFVYERDEKGHIVKQTYHASNDYQLQRSAISDADGIFGRSFSLDSLGRRIKVEYLGLKGEFACTKKGIAGRLYEYDEHGIISKTTYVNQEGKPTLNEQMHAICVDISDERGNVIEECYYGTDGLPCLSNTGIAKSVSKYDDRGNRIECAFFGTDGLPCLSNEGLAKWTARYDDRGNRIECVFFGTDGLPCLSKYGYAKWVSKYDDRENEVESTFFGTDGLPCLSNDGFAKWVSKYDDRGNEIECTFFGTDGEPCMHKDGFAKWTARYDDRGNLIEQAYFGTDSEPCFRNEGYAKLTARYDDRGNRIEEAFFGTDGEPCLHKDGLAKWTARYDDRGNRIETACFGTDGELCFINEGYAKWVSKFDDKGNETGKAYFGINGEPYLINLGYAKWMSKFDDRGNETETAYFGINGEPCLTNMGHAKWVSRFDDRGNLIELTYFGTDGKLCKTNEGWAKSVRTYNERGFWIENEYFGTDEKPCLINGGYAIERAIYNERGQQICIYVLDTDGRPCLSEYGVSKIISKYNNRGYCIKHVFFGTDGKPCLNYNGVSIETYKYDNRGNYIECAYLGIDGKPCLGNDGYSKWTAEYNSMRNQINWAIWGIHDEPIELIGYHRIEKTYDKRHHLIKNAYYNKDNQLLTQQIICPKVTFVKGFALRAGLPFQSIILQMNNWKLGDAYEDFISESNRCRYINKDLYFLTPDSVIMHLHVEKGLMGVDPSIYGIEKSQAEKWMKKLEEWKKEHNDK